MALSPGDPNSYSRPDLILTTNLKFDWTVDFGSETVCGIVEISCKRLVPDTKVLLLDTNSLSIDWVKFNGVTELKYEIGESGCCGAKMTVTLPDNAEEVFTVSIKYSTSPESPALVWMTKDQTSGKQHPFMFSQGQAILNRALFPCQDTPSVKTPYQATVRVPRGLMALMSALNVGDSVTMDDNVTQFTFDQPIPIPSYLVALATGDLVSRDIGPRSRVYAEQEYIEMAAFDFSETERQLSVAEELCGPYLWTRYDILVLPPSFAYGGMENPCLTFVTPTLLTGDKSNSDVIAHEISHSWTGNLITNSTFEHFWLNEGFTVFIERKIKGRLKGEPERHFTSLLRWKELEECVHEEFDPTHEFTKLVPSLIGVDPDDAFCRVPYEKGSTFLWYLEQLVGGADKFEPFLKEYFKAFQYKSLDSDQFKQYFTRYFQDKADIANIDWDTWFFSPGMPPYKPTFDSSLADQCWTEAGKWLDLDSEKMSECDVSASNMTPTQIQEFLSFLIQKTPLKATTLQKMDSLYRFSSSKNYEILYLFLRLGIRSKWTPIIDKTFEFLKKMGRLKFVRPIYRDLGNWQEQKHAAIEFFHANKHLLMSTVVDGVRKDLKC